MKKTLLIAAAALAAGVISSQAQSSVYSQNIVGYVNQALPGGVYTQITIPLQNGDGTNGAENVLPVLQFGDSIYLWNAGLQQYTAYTYFGPGNWQLPNGSFGSAPNLPPGTSLFFAAGVTETNTAVGTVVLSNTNSPITLVGGVYSLIGSLPPVGASSLEDTNLNLPLQFGDGVYLWNQANQTYNAYTYFGPGNWQLPNGSFGPSPALQVGQGFFYAAGVTETWSQNLQVQ